MLIELSIVRPREAKAKEMESKGDLVCHRVPKEREMKNNSINNKRKKSTSTTSATSSTHMCRVLMQKLKNMELIPGTDSTLKDRYLYKKGKDEKELKPSGKINESLNDRELSNGF